MNCWIDYRRLVACDRPKLTILSLDYLPLKLISFQDSSTKSDIKSSLFDHNTSFLHIRRSCASPTFLVSSCNEKWILCKSFTFSLPTNILLALNLARTFCYTIMKCFFTVRLHSQVFVPQDLPSRFSVSFQCKTHYDKWMELVSE